jgi:hypothetical protein
MARLDVMKKTAVFQAGGVWFYGISQRLTSSWMAE